MYWKRLRPFITEAIVFVAIVILFAWVFLFTKMITVRVTVLTIALFIAIVLWFTEYILSFFIFSVKVLLDLITKDFVKSNVKFIEQYPFKSSSFLDERKYIKGIGVKTSETLYFKVVVKDSKSTILLTNSSYFEFEKGKTYTVEFGRRSGALVDVICKS